MNDAFGKASRRLLAKPKDISPGRFIHLAAEAIQAAVRFIRDHDNVLPRAQDYIPEAEPWCLFQVEGPSSDSVTL
jgi:hypothetical protein